MDIYNLIYTIDKSTWWQAVPLLGLIKKFVLWVGLSLPLGWTDKLEQTIRRYKGSGLVVRSGLDYFN